MGPGRVLISFDLELGWGQPGPLAKKQLERVWRARELLPRLVEIVQARDISVTWATTLALAHRDVDEALQFVAEGEGATASATLFPQREALRRYPEAYFFAEFVQSLARLSASVLSEVGCHTYSHPLWNESQPPDLAREFRLSRKMANRLRCTLETLVFPRNRYSSQALSEARAARFLGFRRDAFVSGQERRGAVRVAIGRAQRFLDAFGLSSFARSHSSGPGVELEGGLCSIVGQRFLRLDDPPWMRRIHLSHVRQELRATLQRGDTYHLWSHPENFVASQGEVMHAFTALLDEISELREQGLAVSETMAQRCRAYRDARNSSEDSPPEDGSGPRGTK